MESFKNIESFIVEYFPQEYEKIITRRKTPIENYIETIDKNFIDGLVDAINGKEEHGEEKKHD